MNGWIGIHGPDDQFQLAFNSGCYIRSFANLWLDSWSEKNLKYPGCHGNITSTMRDKWTLFLNINVLQWNSFTLPFSSWQFLVECWHTKDIHLNWSPNFSKSFFQCTSAFGVSTSNLVLEVLKQKFCMQRQSSLWFQNFMQGIKKIYPSGNHLGFL